MPINLENNEIKIENLKDLYNQRLNEVYNKHKKVLQNFLLKLENYVIELKNNLNIMFKRKDEVEIDEKSKVFVDRFYDKVKSYVETLQIPSNPTADDVYDMIEKIKRVFMDIGEAGRKNIPKIGELFKQEILAIEMVTRKMGEQMAKIDEFLRKKYTDVREAERLAKRIPKILESIDRISNAKSTIESLKAQQQQNLKDLENLEKELLALESNPLIENKKEIENKLMQLRLNFDEQIKFKKALKRLKTKIEKSGSFKGITASNIKNYLTDSLDNIAAEGLEHPKLTEFLVQLRWIIENNPDFLQLKSDDRTKTLENINEIVQNKILLPYLKQFNELKENLAIINKQLEKENISFQIDKIKEQISLKTQTSQHLENDLKNKQNEYRQLLEKLKEDREDLQIKIKEYIGDDIKIYITVSY